MTSNAVYGSEKPIKTKKNAQVIAYAGKEKADLVYALVQIAEALHKRIVVIDNSLTHDLYEIYAKRGKSLQNQVIDMGTITIAKNCFLEKELLDSDVVFYYTGLNVNDAIIEPADILILAPGSEAVEIQKMELYVKLIGNATQDIVLIQRDRVTYKITLGTIASKLGIRPKRSYVLKYNPDDYGAYVALTQNGAYGIKGIVPGIKEVAFDISTMIHNLTDKQLRKYIR